MNTLEDKASQLIRLAHLLNSKDRAFAESLSGYFLKNSRWSEKQEFWVDTLTQRAKEIEAAPVQQVLDVGQIPPPAPTPQVGSLIRVVDLFQRAVARGLKYPKIRLETSDGVKIVLRFSTPNISVTDHLPYSEGRQYFGRIGPNGVFVPNFRTTPPILDLLDRLAKDPAGLAKLYGLKTSTCCFCSRPLEASESVTMGYGPICADKFGLPWGQTVETTYTCMTVEGNANAQPNPTS